MAISFCLPISNRIYILVTKTLNSFWCSSSLLAINLENISSSTFKKLEIDFFDGYGVFFDWCLEFEVEWKKFESGSWWNEFEISIQTNDVHTPPTTQVVEVLSMSRTLQYATLNKKEKRDMSYFRHIVRAKVRNAWKNWIGNNFKQK